MREVSADYVVVGAGSAGCVIAARLSEDPSVSVALLEAGKADLLGETRIPAGLMRTLGNPRFDWRFKTEPDPSRNGRRDQWSRGRTLGGSSALNGLIFVRGAAADYDSWAAAGNTGWDWQSVLPLFRRLETSDQPESQLRGKHGPTHVETSAYVHELTPPFIAAAGRRGIPFNPDINGERRDGVGFCQTNILRGRRHSAYDAYVKPNLRRRNLQILKELHVSRILFHGYVAVGVEGRQKQVPVTVRAKRGVILSLGSINTPHLLLLSGVGPAEDLRKAGRVIIRDIAGVGRNFMDHAGVRMPFLVDVETANLQARLWPGAAHVLQWLVTGKGPVGAPSAQAIGFFSRERRPDRLDLQLTLFPFANTVNAHGRAVLPPRPYMAVAVNLNYPQSRGFLRLRDGDPEGQIEIHPRLLEAEEDVECLLEGMRRVREIIQTDPFGPHVVTTEFPSDADGRSADMDFLRTNTRSFMHPIGTCRMGRDTESVVTPDLKVRGLDRLWVADASVFPSHIAGNINATVLMIGEKASDVIRNSDRV